MGTSALEQLVGNMTVAQLAEAAGLSLDEVVALVLKQGAVRSPRAAPKKGGPDPRSSHPKSASTAGSFSISERSHNTRSQAGREALDRAIMSVLRQTGERMRALDIRDAVGGTAGQVRARLNALIGEGRLAYEGQASGTRYWLK